jgi:hypothetical protein
MRNGSDTETPARMSDAGVLVLAGHPFPRGNRFLSAISMRPAGFDSRFPFDVLICFDPFDRRCLLGET